MQNADRIYEINSHLCLMNLKICQYLAVQILNSAKGLAQEDLEKFIVIATSCSKWILLSKFSLQSFQKTIIIILIDSLGKHVFYSN